MQHYSFFANLSPYPFVLRSVSDFSDDDFNDGDNDIITISSFKCHI